MKTNEFIKDINDYIGHEVKVVCTDNEEIFGNLADHILAINNEPDGESIVICLTRKVGWHGAPMEIELDEIESIEVV